MAFRPKPCKNCQSPWHTASYHNRRKPLRREAVKTQVERWETTAAWFEANPPDKDGLWYCYISKHPSCPGWLNADTLNLEHDQSKARRPDLIHDITNIYPACEFDNKAKGSLSAEEYMSA